MGQPLLNKEEAAERLNVTLKWIDRKVASREIPFIRLGRYVRFDPDQLDAWLSLNTQHPGRKRAG